MSILAWFDKYTGAMIVALAIGFAGFAGFTAGRDWSKADRIKELNQCEAQIQEAKVALVECRSAAAREQEKADKADKAKREKYQFDEVLRNLQNMRDELMVRRAFDAARIGGAR